MAKVPSVMHVYRQRRFPSTRKLFSTLSKPSTADPGESSQKPGKESLWSEIKSIAAIARPEALTMSAGVFLLVISSAVTMSVPFSMGRIIDIVMMHLGVHSEANTEVTTETLANIPMPYLFAGLAGIFFIGALANTGRVILMKLAGERIIRKLKNDTYKSLLKQDMSFFDVNRSGELVSRLSLDTSIMGKSVSNNLSDGLRSLISTSLGIGAMAFVNLKLTLIMMSIVPPVALAAIWYGRVVRDLSMRTQDAYGEANRVSDEKLVRAFAQEKAERHLYTQKIQSVYELARKEAFANGLFFGGTGLSGNIVILALLYYGGAQVAEGIMSVGDLTSFFLYTAYVGGSFVGLSTFYSELMKGIGASKRIMELRSLPVNGIELQKRSVKRIENLSGLIEFKNVSGKSSIAQLLLRFYDPSNAEGSITIDGVDLRDLDLDWWRKEVVGFVSQEPAVFAGTVFENIQYGSRESSEEQVYVAAEQANARSFIEAFPEKFDTVLGDKGVGVSGGQKQRIAIARAMLKKPKIAIMDEATSALDASSEILVSDALEKLVQGHTTSITIAHRLSTIKAADWIVMVGETELEELGVIEQGTYSDLLARPDGKFKALVSAQLDKKQR